MKIAVLGASGIIGQHMRLCVPAVVEPTWVRQEPDELHAGSEELRRILDNPSDYLAIINLMGESRPDVVERDPAAFRKINVHTPYVLGMMCSQHNVHYVHVSTQAVFDGTEPPYREDALRSSVNEYGWQKAEAEERVYQSGNRWTIVRPTFVLGVRPLPLVGRQNPMEQMLTSAIQLQVSDRWFSVSFARDVAAELWRIAIGRPQMRPIHVGIPFRVSRYSLAMCCLPTSEVIKACSHSDFVGIAPRPLDTTYAGEGGEVAMKTIMEGAARCRMEISDRETLTVPARAREISLFTGLPEAHCLAELQKGFGVLHGEVREDFRTVNPQNDEELLNWYRNTDAYIWELSAYHCDPGWNYSGMCKGIVQGLKSTGVQRVLCLGDGIGDLTLAFKRAGVEAVYHDLAGSRTAAFAHLRFWMYLGDEAPSEHLTGQWNPEVLVTPNRYDAICSLDFLEHVTDVELWLKAIYAALKPGGLFFAQNAFNCGSGAEGSIPMHLARNDHWEKDWDPCLNAMGFTQISSNWYRRASE